MHFAPMIYSSTFSALRDLQSAEESALPHYLEWLERILRRAGEHRILSEIREEQSPHVGLVDGRPIYEDGFSYTFEKVLRGEDDISWQDYYNSVLIGISEMYPRQDERSNELLRLLVLVSSILQRDGNRIQGKSAKFTNYLDEVHIEHTNPIVAHMRREFGNILSHQFVGGRKDDVKPGNAQPPKESSRLAYENRRRKRKEKHTKKPTQRPRKALADKGRVAQSA
jgi:hypothetical protein